MEILGGQKLETDNLPLGDGITCLTNGQLS